MYTHMGTMPRHQQKKGKTTKSKSPEQKSIKAKGKTKNTQLDRSQSMKPADYVCESPLLTALSGKGLSTLERTTKDPTSTEENKSKNISAPAAESTNKVFKDNPIQAQEPSQVQEPQVMSQCLTDLHIRTSKPLGEPYAPRDVNQIKQFEDKPTLPKKQASKKALVDLKKVTSIETTLTELEEYKEQMALDSEIKQPER